MAYSRANFQTLPYDKQFNETDSSHSLRYEEYGLIAGNGALSGKWVSYRWIQHLIPKYW